MTQRLRQLTPGIAIAALFALVFINLDRLPIFWDEGWTMTVARTWVERGHYGMLLDGEPAPPGLSASFPVVAPVALSFRLLGVGLWQGRLPGLLYALATFALIYILAGRIYNRAVAAGALVVLVLMAPHTQLNPIVEGQLVLGEIPMLFYLLAGFAAMSYAMRRPAWWLGASLCWAVALAAKAQALPFWSLSMLIAFGSLLASRQRQAALGLAASAVMAVLGYRWIVDIPLLFMRDRTLPSPPLEGLYGVTAWVPDAAARAVALATVLFALLPLLGIAYALYREFVERRAVSDSSVLAVRRALLALAGSWYGWYLLMSIGFPRYLFPAVLLGSIFASAWLYDATGGFDLALTVRRASGMVLRLRIDRQGVGAWAGVLAIAMAAPLGVLTLYNVEVTGADDSALQAARFLNAQAPADARIELYSSEVMFALNRRYHFPPDQLNVAVIWRSMQQPDLPIEYDPLAANPDYLVRGPLPGDLYLYDEAIAAGHFRKLRAFGDYEIYGRVR